MGLGSTAKKLQKVTDLAEELYGRMNELRDRVAEMRDTVEDTHSQVSALQREVAEQRAVVEALAAEQGVDVAEVVEDARTEGESPGAPEDGAAGAEPEAGTPAEND